MPVDDFIAMVRAFDADLMVHMALRIHSPQMQTEHDDRCTWLENALSHPVVDDWDTIRAALKY